MITFTNIIAEINNILISNLSARYKKYSKPLLCAEWIELHNSLVHLVLDTDYFIDTFVTNKGVIFDKWVSDYENKIEVSTGRYFSAMKNLFYWNNRISPNYFCGVFCRGRHGKRKACLKLSDVFDKSVMGLRFNWDNSSNSGSNKNFKVSYYYPLDTIISKVENYIEEYDVIHTRISDDFLASVIRPNLTEAEFDFKGIDELKKLRLHVVRGRDRLSDSIRLVEDYILSNFSIRNLLETNSKDKYSKLNHLARIR
jgi:hypothetical protein